MYCNAGSIPATSTNLKLNNMAKLKIKKTGESESLQKSTFYTLSKSFYEVEAIVYSELHRITGIKSSKVYNVEVQDIDTNFFVDGKRVQYSGFKELYEKLFGNETFSSMLSGICEDVEEYYKDSVSKLTLKSLTDSQLQNAWSDLRMSVDIGNHKGVQYADDYYFIDATKMLYPHAVEKMDCPYAHGRNPRSYNHVVVNLDKL